MIKLALEIPTSRLKEWSPLVDLDFIIAHKVLDDPHYKRFFRDRPPGRDLILDNSTHEFGHPIPFEDLRRAAEGVNANVVIAPDIVNPQINYRQYIQNMEWMHTSRTHLKGFDLGGVICGRDVKQRQRWLDQASKLIEVVCFSFHMPQRYEWWKDFVDSGHLKSFSGIHLLGMISISELHQWVRISEQLPEVVFSFDTSKPLKLGVQGRRFMEEKENENLRGGAINSKTILEMKSFTAEQEDCIIDNINYLRAVCRGEA